MTVTNPNDDPQLNAMLALAHGMSTGSPTGFIEGQETRGQRELVASAVLPSDMGDRAAYEAVGFTFGDPVQGDPMFVNATLPDGWRREGSEHAMGSYVLDTLGRKRVSIFYKAAFYDRSAHMTLTTVGSYAIQCSNAWSDDEPTTPILDEEWATRDSFVAALTQYADREDADAARFEGTLRGRTPGNAADCRQVIDVQRARAAKVRVFAAKVAAG